MSQPEQRMCDVCLILDRDQSTKLCTFCGLCNAWICEGCKSNPVRRSLAMLKRKLGAVHA